MTVLLISRVIYEEVCMKCPASCQKSKYFLIIALGFLVSGFVFKSLTPASAHQTSPVIKKINTYNQVDNVQIQQREIIDCLKRLEDEIEKDQG